MLRRLPWPVWLLLAWALLFAAYNPWGWSLVHLGWAAAGGTVAAPLVLLAAAAVALPLSLMLAATWRSIGALGIGIVASLLVLLVYTAVFYGALDPASGRAWEVLPQLLGGVVLTVGLRWPSFRRAASGVIVTDDGEH